MATRLESSLKSNDNHFGEEEARTNRVAPLPTILTELSESEKIHLLRIERASLVKKLEASLIETNTYKDELKKLKKRCRLEKELFSRSTHGSVELKDQLERKYREVEELYDQQAHDRKEINSLQLQCKEGERMIRNLRGNVDTLMKEADKARLKRREELNALKRENLQLCERLRNSNSIPRQSNTLPQYWASSNPIPIPVLGSRVESMYGYSFSPVSDQASFSLMCYMCSQPQRVEDIQQHFIQCEKQRQTRAEEMADLLGTDTQPFSLRTE